jgi:hypothetical protein
MGFIIKYIKDGAFVASEDFAGPLEAATKLAADGVKVHQADLAAVMAADDLDGAPKALVTASP